MPPKRPDRAATRRPTRTNLSDELRDCIDRDGRPLHAITRAAGVSPACLSRFMAGTHGLTIDTIDRLAAELGLHLGAATRPRGRPRSTITATVAGDPAEDSETEIPV